MKECPFCGQQNREENRFCNKCGTEMVNQTQAPVAVLQTSPFTKGYVKFVLCIFSIFAPPLGLLFGLLVSLSPFENQQRLSSGLIKASAACMIVWPFFAFWMAFVVGLSSAL